MIPFFEQDKSWHFLTIFEQVAPVKPGGQIQIPHCKAPMKLQSDEFGIGGIFMQSNSQIVFIFTEIDSESLGVFIENSCGTGFKHAFSEFSKFTEKSIFSPG